MNRSSLRSFILVFLDFFRQKLSDESSKVDIDFFPFPFWLLCELSLSVNGSENWSSILCFPFHFLRDSRQSREEHCYVRPSVRTFELVIREHWNVAPGGAYVGLFSLWSSQGEERTTLPPPKALIPHPRHPHLSQPEKWPFFVEVTFVFMPPPFSMSKAIVSCVWNTTHIARPTT